jgi:arabinose-5-phosphate isomerase
MSSNTIHAPGLTPRLSSGALDLARRVMEIEAEAVAALGRRLNRQFLQAAELLLACRGRVVVSGIGKSGHVARKIASTMASTGTPAFFVHPAEANHGDLGMITSHDVLIAISYSGETEELLSIVPLVKRQGAGLISMTGNTRSSLAREADIHLDCKVDQEACPLNLAPTASTTATLALGDALAITLLDARGFGPDDFARSHPGGALGRRLLTHVADIMRTGDEIPCVPDSASFADAVLEISRKRMGMTAVVDSQQKLVGIFTDGDLRRSLEQGADMRQARVSDVMTRNPRSIRPQALAVEAAQLMEQFKTTQLPVVDEHGLLTGALNVHDLFRAKVI